MDWIVRPIRAVIFADEQAFLWIKKKLGLTEYQMAALVWFKGIIIGLLLGWWPVSYTHLTLPTNREV